MSMTCKTLVLTLLFTLMTTPSWAQSGYDEIVEDLTSRRGTASTRLQNSDFFSDVKIYLGAGWVNSFFQPANSDTKDLIWHSGVMLTLGIDLLSRHWIAEGSIKNYGSTSLNGNEYSLKDFDLKLIHQAKPWAAVRSRWGVGLGGRFLEHKNLEGSHSYSTPYATASVGLMGLLSDHIQLGGEVGARTSLVSETIDRFSFDAAIKLDTFF
jgi:hypothetical protein